MNRHRLALLIVSLIVVLVSCAREDHVRDGQDDLQQIFAHYPELKDQPYEEEVVGRVIYGDTIETRSGHKVRFIGMDTPEVHGRVEYYGNEASVFTQKHLHNKTVYMFQDVSDTDRYGRLLRYVFIKGNPIMFNETFLLEGYANTMTFPPDVMFVDKFLASERQAREEEKGLWREN